MLEENAAKDCLGVDRGSSSHEEWIQAHYPPGNSGYLKKQRTMAQAPPQTDGKVNGIPTVHTKCCGEVILTACADCTLLKTS